jgi:DNA-binding protein H-NS
MGEIAAEEAAKEGAALVTQTMELEQVQREIASGKTDWIQAMQKEFDGLVQMRAKEEIDEADVWSGKEPTTILPGKAAFAKKPDKYKARCVVCGNYENKKSDISTCAAGVHASALRIVLQLAMKYDWEIMSTDAAAAFLNTSLSELPGERGNDEIYMKPPRIFVAAGVVRPTYL